MENYSSHVSVRNRWVLILKFQLPNVQIVASDSKMKFVIILSVLVVYVSTFPAEEKYKSQYEDMDIDEILHSTRLLKNYFECLMDRGRCPPPAKELKDHIDDALQTECTKCTDKQKQLGTKVINFMIENHPDMWSSLESKYDPEGVYMAKWKAHQEKESKQKKE